MSSAQWDKPDRAYATLLAAERTAPGESPAASCAGTTTSTTCWPGLHVCYGNRYARPSWKGHDDSLFPAVLDANVEQLALESGRKEYEDLQVIQRFGGDRALGLGVVDVKSEQIESAELIAQRILKARETFPADKLIINPDCGLRHLPADVARWKLAVMVKGTVAVRRILPHQSGHTQLAEPHDRTVTSPELTVEQGA